MWSHQAVSARKARLPSNWYGPHGLREAVLHRDSGACQWAGTTGPCGETATEVDHIRAGDDHSMGNLQALCSYHHRRKTASEAGHSKARTKVSTKRTPEPHPGMR